MSIYDCFPTVVSKDLFELVCGTKLGEGVARQVYRSNLDPSTVLKFETSAGSFQNILEWETWEAVKFTPYVKWFTPCVCISSCGTVLVQKFARNVEDIDIAAHSHLPAFFTDIKKDNWGVLDGQLVCRDYGRTLLLDRGLSKKLRKADW
jgi:hypothetical protein